jgi:hypothetical protein
MVVKNLASSLQELTTDFRKNQNLYLKSNLLNNKLKNFKF